MKKWLPNCFKSPQFLLALFVALVLIILYCYQYGQLSIDFWCGLQFPKRPILIAIIILLFVYTVASYYFPCAVATVKPECFENHTKLSIHTDGKAYTIKFKNPHIKIYFAKKGKHKVYLYDNNNKLLSCISNPQEVNTYEHPVDYIEFAQDKDSNSLNEEEKT